MLDAIKRFFDNKLAQEDTVDPAIDLSKTDLACAALLIEVMNSDHELDQRETDEFLKVLQDCLKVSDEDLDQLIELAHTQSQQATSLYEFTRLINDAYNYEQKVLLIENMWRIAFSDEHLDKYEDHLIRKISELIYVTHSDFIKSKLKVRNRSS
ncbi:MAG: TerB family tellurite resistance protein [Gammaproteobacteria bacterium]|jgi:uncharacterized tellurite resistance protein B-like protein|nr:TerB family tellurite resistance protein [Gammaproteobacteria bacterium]MDP6536247.1 TerB family tellurite resistance protein [Gammaproteobacteria bacterium]MDP6732288.1 TerB family tellurite resistance protein [Gammaproteobacteria bacterium]HAJ74883.1 hypothetical protein [Gammaproteobacteria bacterium]|tara:strand:- start:83 stop:544 length:462 start_codon:yes stop_codon:yes gene_type:complete